MTPIPEHLITAGHPKKVISDSVKFSQLRSKHSNLNIPGQINQWTFFYLKASVNSKSPGLNFQTLLKAEVNEVPQITHLPLISVAILGPLLEKGKRGNLSFISIYFLCFVYFILCSALLPNWSEIDYTKII